ncbi:MAG: squalene synthase HpnC [Alphaproteobacteria bacterium]|nr:MAG: squalene synthase HpnC [Alphaproteobacteria bacterium]
MRETPPSRPSRTADQENFPVASRLLRADVRPLVMAFYRLARAADDVADSDTLSAAVKVTQLEIVARQLGDDIAGQCLRDLLVAFRWDAEERTYPSWPALVDGYCAHSAGPVARFLLETHGEDPLTLRPGEALAAALQVLNHLQDIRDDWVRLRRLYLPLDWMAEAGVTIDMLSLHVSTPNLRLVIDRMLDGCAQLLDQARPLPRLVRDPGLRAQSRTTVVLARRLLRRLRRGDPMADRVALSRMDWGLAACAGLAAGGWPLVRRLAGVGR